jgi:hypothetical protein
MELTEISYPAKMESISDTGFSDNKDNLAHQLSEMVIQTGKVQSNDKKEWLCERIETGINKLRSLGAEAEADSFEDVLKNIKPKWWR